MDDKEYKEFMSGVQWTPEQLETIKKRQNMGCKKKGRGKGGTGKKGGY